MMTSVPALLAVQLDHIADDDSRPFVLASDAGFGRYGAFVIIDQREPDEPVTHPFAYWPEDFAPDAMQTTSALLFWIATDRRVWSEEDTARFFGAAPHPAYGPCDAFGPFGHCSACTGRIQRDDGSVIDHAGNVVSPSPGGALIDGNGI